jgi:hypothetical protein
VVLLYGIAFALVAWILRSWFFAFVNVPMVALLVFVGVDITRQARSDNARSTMLIRLEGRSPANVFRQVVGGVGGVTFLVAASGLCANRVFWSSSGNLSVMSGIYLLLGAALVATAVSVRSRS